jgi:hypothetical protein
VSQEGEVQVAPGPMVDSSQAQPASDHSECV